MRLYFSTLVILLVIFVVDLLSALYIYKIKPRNSRILIQCVLIPAAIYFFYFLSISLLSPIYASADGENIYLHFFIAITWFMIWYVPRMLGIVLFPIFILPIHYFKASFARNLFHSLLVLLLILPLGGVVVGNRILVKREQAVTMPAPSNAFNGYRVVLFSDMHLGTMPWAKGRWKNYVEEINRLSPNLIVFTGDLVNNFWTETNGWDSVFSSLKAYDGKLAVLGNHDYGDYVRWKTPYDKFYNQKKILSFFQKNGFRVLNNEHFALNRNNDTLIIVGVENWGHSIFPKYSNLNKALEKVEKHVPVLLLSHNPEHWDNEILNSQWNIFLTLSGHTHGFQTGLRTNRLAFSLSALKYRYWGGYYLQGDKQLYVSTGVGNIAYMGRMGIWPEIVTLEFHCQ